MKRSPLEVYILTYITGGIYLLIWGSRLMHIINAELNHTFFNPNRIRNIILFCWVSGFLVGPLLFLGVISKVLVWIFAPIFISLIITILITLIYSWYRIALGIREIEMKQFKSKLVKPYIAVILIFPYFLSILYLQSHVNELQLDNIEN